MQPSYVGGPPSRRTQVLVRSGLSMSVLASRSNTVFTAWVTDASEGSGGGGVAGATVSFYVLPTSGYYREGSEVSTVPCTAGADVSFRKFGVAPLSTP